MGGALSHLDAALSANATGQTPPFNQLEEYAMHKIVQDYYGKQLQNPGDLKTSACCDASSVPGWLKPLLARIHPAMLLKRFVTRLN